MAEQKLTAVDVAKMVAGMVSDAAATGTRMFDAYQRGELTEEDVAAMVESHKSARAAWDDALKQSGKG
jgi:hypothetical protein